MARKHKVITIRDENRDKGRNYLITELPASQAEKWAARAFLAIARSGVEIPRDVMSAGVQGLLMLGLKALIGFDFHEAEPLLDEMMRCVRIIPDMRMPEMVRELQEADIEEISTRFTLRWAIVELHTSFFTEGQKSNST